MSTIVSTPGGDALHELRQELGLTQDELAEVAHLNQGHISLVERGHRKLTAEVAMRIIKRCNVSDPQRLLQHVELGGYLTAAA